MAKGTSKPAPVDKLSFEQAMTELEQLVERIESGEIGLEEAIRRYERGIGLIKRCRSVLDSAEQRIAELTTNAKGELSVGEEAELGEAEANAQAGEDEENVE